MKNLAKILSIVTFLTLNQTEIKAQPDKTNKEAVSIYQNLSSLISYLKENNLKIDSLLTDSRFEVYENLSNSFKKAPEIKINNLKQYKKLLDFEKKTKLLPEFICDNLTHLEITEKKYNIPKEIISAVIGIESEFGEIIGKYNPFNVYVSLYSEEYKRDFAKSQLKELLIFCNKNNLDVFDLKSSYAGAVSYAQFIPSSLNFWFIGGDLYHIENNISSVANYLSYFKKRTGSLEKALFSYNPSKLYVDAVLDPAKEGKKDGTYFLDKK